MLFPTHFDDFEAEYWHLLKHVTLWDVAVERCLEVSGKDGFRLAQLMTPRDLSKCAVGQAKYVLHLRGRRRDPERPGDDPDERGPVLVRAGLERRPVLRQGLWPTARGSMSRSARRRPTRCRSRGPSPATWCATLFGDEILDLKYYFFREAKVDGIPVIITRTGWTSEIGYEVYLLDPSRGTELWERILQGRRAVRHPAHRPQRHPPDRGRHLQLGRRHDVREQPVRAGARAAGGLRHDG